MIYLRACFHRYLFFLIPSLFLGLPFYYISEEFDLVKITYFLIFILSIGISSILFRKIYKIKQYEPLKHFLEKSNITTNSENLKAIYLAFVFSITFFISIILWLILSVYGGFYFFLYVLIFIILNFLLFEKRIRFFDKGINFIAIPIIVVIFPNLLIFELSKTGIHYFQYLDLINLSILVASYVILKDIKNIFSDHQLDKKTIPNIFSVEKSKKIIYILSISSYLIIVLKIFTLQSVFFLIPLFSTPLLINILLKIHKIVGNELKNNLRFLFYFILFHTFLIFLSNLFTIKNILLK